MPPGTYRTCNEYATSERVCMPGYSFSAMSSIGTELIIDGLEQRQADLDRA